MPRTCPGVLDAPCRFSTSQAGEPAQPTRGHGACSFCDLERLEEAGDDFRRVQRDPYAPSDLTALCFLDSMGKSFTQKFRKSLRFCVASTRTSTTRLWPVWLTSTTSSSPATAPPGLVARKPGAAVKPIIHVASQLMGKAAGLKASTLSDVSSATQGPWNKRSGPRRVAATSCVC